MDKESITLAHGNGGLLMQQLIRDLIIKNFDNKILNRLDDSAVFDVLFREGKIAFTTDSFVVSPVFFPGGDIGKLAVCGTVNDLLMVGAKPLYLSAGFIIEEGLKISDLKRIVESMKKAAETANVAFVCGDTKVVNKGSCDKIFINTSGVGWVDKKVRLSSGFARPGDAIIISGTIAEHGIAVLNQREQLGFKDNLKSDCALLSGLVKGVLKFFPHIHAMRDPTRGGIAAVLNEIAESSNVGIEVNEEKIPIAENVKAACELLGFDPLYLACEGRLVAFVRQHKAEEILKEIRKNKLGRCAKIIGRVVGKHRKEVYLDTVAGSRRILDMHIQEQMPRIC